MEIFCIVGRDDIAQRWAQALGTELTRLEPALSAAALPGSGVCLAHWGSLTQAQRELLLTHAHHHPLLLVALTDHPQTQEGRELVRRGVKGYGNTFITSELLQELIAAVKAGNIWAGPEVLQSVLRELLDQVDPPAQTLCERFGLSEREQEVLDEVMTGASNKVVARRLDITERTVKAHMSAILSKTGAHDRVELILMAQKAELNAV
jgi:DNA-binding NarL/FixJ family response regulator